MAGERNPNRTPVDVEERVVALARQGKSRREVKEATGLAVSTITRIVREAGVEWGRVNSGSSGTREALAEARGYRSKYQANKREETATKLLDQLVRTATLLERDMPPRERQALSQSLDALTRAYANITKNDVEVSEREQMKKSMSMLDLLMVQIQSRPRPENTRDEVQPDGSVITYIGDQAVVYH